MKALFPISLNNQRFSTKTVVPLLGDLAENYADIYFIIADKLQLYNKAYAVFQKWATSGATGSNPPLFASEKRLVGTKDERHRWIKRVQEALRPNSMQSHFHVYTVDEVADRECFEIIRRVRTLYELDDNFKRDIESAANDFIMKISPRVNFALQAHARGISVNYFIEEIALSIRIKTQNNIKDEYYIGQTIAPIWKLYNGTYMSSVWELAGLPHGVDDFRFFEVRNNHFQEINLLV